MGKPAPGTTLAQQTAALHVGKLRRHILLCAGPECIAASEGESAWNYLKRRVQELKLHMEPHELYRTKAHCLRVCMEGPIMVIYPDGTWYRAASPEIIERILIEHVIGGTPVSEFVLAMNPLPDLASK